WRSSPPWAGSAADRTDVTLRVKASTDLSPWPKVELAAGQGPQTFQQWGRMRDAIVSVHGAALSLTMSWVHPAPLVCHCLPGTCAAEWLFPCRSRSPASYPHLSPGLGWTGKARKLKRSRPFRPGRVLGRSWQTCAEAGSHPVKNSVISNSCEGFGGATRALSTAACDNGPNVARFLVKSDGLN